MASKLNFRARTLDATKPMAIYHSDELPELTDLNAINRSVPAMPSGMEKEEESEKHLQDILDAQRDHKQELADMLVIPTPEVFAGDDSGEEAFESLYKADYKVQRTFIHVQPFNADNDLPDYDMDEQDVDFLDKIIRDEKKFDYVDELTFEAMMDRLEKNSGGGGGLIEPQEAKQLLKEDDDLILAVYDYWVDKRLRLRQPLMPTVKSDKKDFGPSAAMSVTATMTTTTANQAQAGQGQGGQQATNPYVAFRRRTEKMQTRKNRKNDEVSYEKMVKLRRDIIRAIGLLDLVKRREKIKKEHVNLTAEIFERRFSVGDFEGKVFEDVVRKTPPSSSKLLQPIHPDVWLGHPDLAQVSMMMTSTMVTAAAATASKERRSNKKRKWAKSVQKQRRHLTTTTTLASLDFGTGTSDDDDLMTSQSDAECEDDNKGIFGFRRKRNCQYLKPLSLDCYRCPLTIDGPGIVTASLENVSPDHSKSRFVYGSLSTPRQRYVGLIRRRVGRGGRIVIDRIHHHQHDRSDGLVLDPFDYQRPESPSEVLPPEGELLYRPVTPSHYRDDWNVEEDLLVADRLVSHHLCGKSGLSHRSNSNTHNVRHRSASGLNVKPVPVDSVVAQNAASAVVTSDVLDIFTAV